MVAVPSIGRADRQQVAHSAPEAEATRRLYEQYARQIYAYCLQQLRSKEEAEDATQSTFLNAFRGLQRGVDPEFESAWLYKIAQNVCLTRQRSSTRRRRIESPGDLDAIQDVLPAREVSSDELIGLPEVLHDMPEQQRRALLLREWQGLSYREIAEELDVSQAAVETLIFRARRTLANGLADEPTTRGGDAGSLFAILKSLLLTGGAKVVATVATVAATSVVAATPTARHAVEHAVVAFDPPQAKPAHVVHHAARRAGASSAAARAAASSTVRATAAGTRKPAVGKKAPHRARHHVAAAANDRHGASGHLPADPVVTAPPVVPAAAPAVAAATPTAPAAPAAPAPAPAQAAAPAPTPQPAPAPKVIDTTPVSTPAQPAATPAQPASSGPGTRTNTVSTPLAADDPASPVATPSAVVPETSVPVTTTAVAAAPTTATPAASPPATTTTTTTTTTAATPPPPPPAPPHARSGTSTAP